jgi:hypothetical protein
MQPCVRTFNDPSSAVAAKFSTVLMSGSLVVATPRHDRFNTLLSKLFAQRIGIVSAVHDQPVGTLSWATRFAPATNRYFVERFLKQLYFRWRRRVHVNSERSTFAIDQNHKLRSLTPFGFTNFRPPFFAGTKVPSAKHSSQRILSLSFNSARNARQRLSKVPLFQSPPHG